MPKDFKNMTMQQVLKLAEKNREESKSELDEELKKRGRTRKGQKKTAYVDRSEDPKLSSVDHRSLFKEMKKKPYHS